MLLLLRSFGAEGVPIAGYVIFKQACFAFIQFRHQFQNRAAVLFPS